MSTYFDYHHTANDTLGEVSCADLDQFAAGCTTFAFTVADMKAEFGRAPPDKRRDD